MSGSGSGLKKFMDPDPVCPERLDPDPVNIRPEPQPWTLLSSLLWIDKIGIQLWLNVDERVSVMRF